MVEAHRILFLGLGVVPGNIATEAEAEEAASLADKVHWAVVKGLVWNLHNQCSNHKVEAFKTLARVCATFCRSSILSIKRCVIS